MFSWAQPSYCETEEEYFLSKALFMKFVASRQVREVLGLGVGDAIIKFARESVILTKKERPIISDMVCFISKLTRIVATREPTTV
jgi:hypothetical protein